MKEFNILNPTELWEYFNEILHTTKEFCLDEVGLEFEGKLHYTPLIFTNCLDIVLTTFDYNSHRAKYSVNLYHREPYEDCTNDLVLSFSLQENELNNLDIITEKFKKSCREYLLKQEQNNIQQTISMLASKLIKEDINQILNNKCNGLMFNFNKNELYLVEDCNKFIKE